MTMTLEFVLVKKTKRFGQQFSPMANGKFCIYNFYFLSILNVFSFIYTTDFLPFQSYRRFETVHFSKVRYCETSLIMKNSGM